MLVDTSVWIDFFNDRDNAATQLLAYSVSNCPITINGLIYTEILQGIRVDKEYAQVKSILDNLDYLEIDKTIHLNAATIYRKLRKKGITIRSTIDCIIAASAIESGEILLHNDVDYVHIEKHSRLKVAKLS